jgi:hypothetical protein
MKIAAEKKQLGSLEVAPRPWVDGRPVGGSPIITTTRDALGQRVETFAAGCI